MVFDLDTPITQNITLIPVFTVNNNDPSIKYCPKTDKLELSPQGTVKTIECSDGKTGNVKYTCKNDGTWIEQNNCTNSETTDDSSNKDDSDKNTISDEEMSNYILYGSIGVGAVLLLFIVANL